MVEFYLFAYREFFASRYEENDSKARYLTLLIRNRTIIDYLLLIPFKFLYTTKPLRKILRLLSTDKRMTVNSHHSACIAFPRQSHLTIIYVHKVTNRFVWDCSLSVFASFHAHQTIYYINDHFYFHFQGWHLS